MAEKVQSKERVLLYSNNVGLGDGRPGRRRQGRLKGVSRGIPKRMRPGRIPDLQRGPGTISSPVRAVGGKKKCKPRGTDVKNSFERPIIYSIQKITPGKAYIWYRGRNPMTRIELHKEAATIDARQFHPREDQPGGGGLGRRHHLVLLFLKLGLGDREYD